MRLAGFVALLAISAAGLASAQTRIVDFTQDAVGQAPKGFEFGLTAKAGRPGRWVVQAEGNDKHFAQLDDDCTGSRFPVALLRTPRWPMAISRTLRVVVRGSLFEVYHDGRKLYEVDDTTFTRAGKVGVWTKADSVTYFDDLTVVR